MSPLDASFLHDLAWSLAMCALVGAGFASLLVAKSLHDFTRTGPQIADEVLAHYRLYLVYAMGRLGFYAFLISGFMACIGAAAYLVGLLVTGAAYHPVAAGAAAIAGLLMLSTRQFLGTLLL